MFLVCNKLFGFSFESVCACFGQKSSSVGIAVHYHEVFSVWICLSTARFIALRTNAVLFVMSLGRAMGVVS